MKGIGQSCCRRAAKTFGVIAFHVYQEGIIEIIRGKHFTAIRRPPNAKFIQKIARYLDNSSFNQNLGRLDIKLFDQFQYLREEVNIGGYQQRITELIGNNADAPNQITDRANGVAIGATLHIWLAVQPW